MPLPIFLLKFRSAHGRNPKPEELTDDARGHLLKCCMENIERDAKAEATIKLLEEDIATMTKTLESIRSHKPDTERWFDLIEECVGVGDGPQIEEE